MYINLTLSVHSQNRVATFQSNGKHYLIQLDNCTLSLPEADFGVLLKMMLAFRTAELDAEIVQLNTEIETVDATIAILTELKDNND